MSAFTGWLTLTELDLDWRLWRLESPLTYEVGELGSGLTIVVPVGFITDGASVPRVFWGVLPVWGTYSRAAVVHDYLGYVAAKGEPHELAPTTTDADRLFLEAMKVCGTSWPVRHLLWVAVRLASYLPWLRTLGVHDGPAAVAR